MWNLNVIVSDCVSLLVPFMSVLLCQFQFDSNIVGKKDKYSVAKMLSPKVTVFAQILFVSNYLVFIFKFRGVKTN